MIAGMKQVEVISSARPSRRLTAVQQCRVEALRALVQQYGTQASLAEACMMDPSYISQLLNGHRPMGERTARRLERELSLRPMSLDQLSQTSIPLTHDDSAAHCPPRMAPFLEWEDVKVWPQRGRQRQEDPDTACETPARAGPRAFWVSMYDCSMTSHQGLSVPEGYRVLVDPGLKPVSGSLVVAEAGSERSMTLRQLVVDPGGRYLRPLNPAFATYQLRARDRVVGVAVEIARSL